MPSNPWDIPPTAEELIASQGHAGSHDGWNTPPTPEEMGHPNTPPGISPIESVVRGGAQGLTFDNEEELAGAANVAGFDKSTLAGFAGGPLAGLAHMGMQAGGKLVDYFRDPNESVVENYRAGRDPEIAANQLAHDANPKLYTGAKIAGNVAATAVLPGGATSSVLRSAGTFGALGALSGSGASKADLTQGEVGPYLDDVKERGKEGAILGGYLHTAGEGLGAFRDLAKAGTSAARSAVASSADSLANRGLARAAGIAGTDKAAVQTVGKQIADEGLLKARDVINPFKSVPESVSDRAGVAADKADIEVANAVRRVEARAKASGVKLNKTEMADYIDEHVLPQLDEHAEASKITAVKKYTDSLRNSDNQEPTFTESVGHKRALGKEAYPNKKELQKYNEDPELSKTMDANQKTYEGLRQNLEDKANQIDPAAGAAYKAANAHKSSLQSIETLSHQAASRKDLSERLTRWAARAALGTAGFSGGGLTGGAAGFAAADVLTSVLKQRGPAVAALAAKTLAKVLNGTGKASTAAQMILERPERLGPYLQDLLNAAGRSEDEFLQMHETLAHDSGYRKLIRKNDRAYRQQR